VASRDLSIVRFLNILEIIKSLNDIRKSENKNSIKQSNTRIKETLLSDEASLNISILNIKKRISDIVTRIFKIFLIFI
tara:strand:- start:273 stop:506 length:234 start_codon:yes stop_codon:yes gene_type:complete